MNSTWLAEEDKTSILSTLPVFLFSNSPALGDLLSRPECWDAFDEAPERWRLWCYAASLQRDSSRPDHVFERRWEKFREDWDCNLLSALRCVCNGYLEIRNARLYIKEIQAFGRWQNLRSRMTTLPVKVYMLHSAGLKPVHRLAHPDSRPVDDMIMREGLNETHLHLHAYLYPEESWLYDLYHLGCFRRREAKAYQKNTWMQELYTSVDSEMEPVRLVRRMRLAMILRAGILLILDSFGQLDFVREVLNKMAIEVNRMQNREYPLNNTLNAAYLIPRSLEELKRQELNLWYDSFDLLESVPGDVFPFKKDFLSYLHLYLLLENEYIQLNRHNEGRHGFIAFSRTFDHQRAFVGKSAYYRQTFLQIFRAANPSTRNSIEVRISPELLLRDNDKKGSHRKVTGISHIIRLWKASWQNWEAGEIRRRRTEPPEEALAEALLPRLIVVVHLIKRTAEAKLRHNFLYQSLRKKYMREAANLAKTVRRISDKYHVSMGIDAAGSELRMPVEVIAPAYRLFEKMTQISHKTYHCGEDFYHLTSGIRAVYEALIFLDLRAGNRIGHATAIGILPNLWREKMPARLVLRRSDYLLDLIFAWKILKDSNAEISTKIKNEALRVSELIFGDSTTHDGVFSMHVLEDLFDARHLNPEYTSDWLSARRVPFGRVRQSETAEIERFAVKRGTSGLKLFVRWSWNMDVRKEMVKDIEVETAFLSDADLLLLQQRVQAEVRRRGVVIETLPVSNLRISQYTNIHQHHLLRWLGVGAHRIEGDTEMNICMGSDDPGIFVTDIKNEYYHFFNMLRAADVSEPEALRLLRQVNEAGRIFSFKDSPSSLEY